MATTIQGSTGSKTMTCTLNYITSGGQWGYHSGKISDAAFFYVSLPDGYQSIKSCSVYLTTSVKDDYGRFGSVSRSATVYMANNSATTGNELKDTEGKTSCSVVGSAFTLGSTALDTINSSKPKQLGVRIGVTSSGSDYVPSTQIEDQSGQTTSVQGKATLTVESFYIVIESDSGGVVYYHNGTEWVKCEAYYYDNGWKKCEAYRHNGTDWEKCGCS